MIKPFNILKAIKILALISYVSVASLAESETIKVGFVYVSKVRDAGWTFQHDLARKQLEESFGGRVITVFNENVPVGAAPRVMRDMARSGCKVVFATSFGYMNQTIKVAKDFPNTVFMHATGYKMRDNVGVYNSRFYEGHYLNGVIAGYMTRSNIAGVVAAFPIPEVLMGINAFTCGMRSVKPNAKVIVVWTHDWFNPSKERDTSISLIKKGADVLIHHTDSVAVMQAAEENSIIAFGHHSNEITYGPNVQMSGTIHLWGKFYTNTVSQVLAGTWRSSNTWGGFKEGMVALSPFNESVPKGLRLKIINLKSQIIKGDLHPFTGPIFDQTGSERVPAGKVISDYELKKMDYFVLGVDGKLDNSTKRTCINGLQL